MDTVLQYYHYLSVYTGKRYFQVLATIIFTVQLLLLYVPHLRRERKAAQRKAQKRRQSPTMATTIIATRSSSSSRHHSRKRRTNNKSSINRKPTNLYLTSRHPNQPPEQNFCAPRHIVLMARASPTLDLPAVPTDTEESKQPFARACRSTCIAVSRQKQNWGNNLNE